MCRKWWCVISFIIMLNVWVCKFERTFRHLCKACENKQVHYIWRGVQAYEVSLGFDSSITVAKDTKLKWLKYHAFKYAMLKPKSWICNELELIFQFERKKHHNKMGKPKPNYIAPRQKNQTMLHSND